MGINYNIKFSIIDIIFFKFEWYNKDYIGRKLTNWDNWKKKL